MKIIERLCEKIEEEIHDAECYVRMAIELKDERPDLARALYTISTQEMEHMGILHEHVTQIISAYREKEGSPPDGMLAAYNILHRRHIDGAATVRALQALYKDGAI